LIDVKKALFAVVLVLLLPFLTLEDATANPAPAVSYSENPDTTQPTIMVDQPQNSQISNVNYATLSFSVQKPQSWFTIDPVPGDLVSIVT
jgi:hypothetical protein